LELTVHVRRVPAEGWVRAVFETDDLHNGLFVESGSLWDSNGELVARSRQVAMLRELEAS
ncbi:MAG: thioesterase family protein, partial [Actinomycetota bacterium]|nr:thioesterase family protein [Actinomycetota bacterium]